MAVITLTYSVNRMMNLKLWILCVLHFYYIANCKKTTITGQNIINCRTFNIQSPKTFSLIGSYKSESSIPTLNLPEIAFVGRSNVGKSSLLNCLTGLNKKVAVESKTPGRTQSINMFKCEDKEGDICAFVDLPGYGFAKMSKGQQEEVGKFLYDYLSNRPPLRLVILLVDIRREPQALDRDMLNFLKNEGLPYLIVTTKCDKIASKSEIENTLGKFSKEFEIYPKLPVKFSSVTGLGKKDVWAAIKGGILGDSSLLSGSLYDAEEDEEDEESSEEDED